jgi:hypothetical protein
MLLLTTTVLILGVALGTAGTSAAQEHAHHPPPGEARSPTARPAAVAPFLDHGPRIDGRLDPGEWDGAARLGHFIQRDPYEGEPATERTEVLVARDRSTLFVAFIAWDSDMSGVRAVHSARDRLATASDLVGIWVDPTQTGTRAFGFQFNPLGVQYDGIWARQWDSSWDGVLASSGSLAGDHFIVEVAIPIATVVSGVSPENWSINFSRVVGRKSEESWWSPLARARRTAMLGDFGTLGGMRTEGSGVRIETIPTLVGSTYGRSTAGGRSWSRDVGLTTRMAVGGMARLDATLNPDFSFVEGDDAQIAANERWALFYPEKRPFFLEEADRFGVPAANFVAGPLQLVHTRSIMRPRAGVRFTASPSRLFLGAAWTSQDRFDGVADGSTAIARVVRHFDNSSQAGFTLTHRDRPDGRRNTVAATDAQARLGDHVTSTAQVATSVTKGPYGAEQSATALYFDIARNDGNGFEEIVLRRIPAGFETDVGFVPRVDLIQAVTHVGRYWRPASGTLQWVNPMLQVVASQHASGGFADLEWLPHVEAQFTRETHVFVGYRIRDEHFRGRTHGARRFEARVRSKPRAWLDAGAGVRLGDRLRYDMDLDVPDRSAVVRWSEVQGSADLKVGPSGSLSVSLVRQSIGSLSGLQAQDLWVARTRAVWQFDNATALRLFVQRDPERRRWAQSLIVAHERDYGTQYHVGLQRGWDADALSAEGGALRGFVRISHRFVAR